MDQIAVLATQAIVILSPPTLGQNGRCCTRCRRLTSGSERHVCPGYGKRVSKAIILAVAARDAWICQLYGKPVDPRVPASHPFALTVDHRLPRSEGGPNHPDNLQIAHKLCNELRDTAPLEDLDLRDLRVRFGQAWSRYLRRHPYADLVAVVESRLHRRERRRAQRARRSARRAAERLIAAPATSVSSVATIFP